MAPPLMNVNYIPPLNFHAEHGYYMYCVKERHNQERLQHYLHEYVDDVVYVWNGEWEFHVFLFDDVQAF